MSRALLVCNRHAGATTPNRIARVQAALARFGSVERVETTPGGAVNYLTPKLTGNVRRVYVLGGDGTVGDVAGVLQSSDIPIGIIPGGTTNVLAQECRIPLNSTRTARALGGSDNVRPFRTWSSGARTLVLGLGVSFDARLMARTSVSSKRRWGIVAVGVTAIREALRYEFPIIDLAGEDSNGQAFQAQGTFVLVSNTARWAGHCITMPGADPSDDLLDVLVFSSRRRSDLVAFWGLVGLPGCHHLRVPGVRIIRARRLRLDSASGVETHINGDLHDRVPVRLEPSGSVQMIVPQSGFL